MSTITRPAPSTRVAVEEALRERGAGGSEASRIARTMFTMSDACVGRNNPASRVWGDVMVRVATMATATATTAVMAYSKDWN